MISEEFSQIDDYLQFLNSSPSSYHAVNNIAQRLEEIDFKPHSLRRPWSQIAPRGYTMRGGALVAWVIPSGMGAHNLAFNILGAHSDSPAFKLKPRPGSLTDADGWELLSVEVYGGMLYNSWLDRDLGLAGRVYDEDGHQHLVQTGPIARIPQLAIHLDRQVNERGLKLDPQQHLRPLWGFDHGQDIYDHLAELAGIEQIIGADIYTFPTEGAALIGLDSSLVAGARQDNLSSVHAGLWALEDLIGTVEDPQKIAVYVVFDHEEVGSATTTGAGGPLLEGVLERISLALGAGREAYRCALENSLLLSADAGHLVHPNYAHHHDSNHHPRPGGGPLLKINAQQRYATNGTGTARWHRWCQTAGVDYQSFVSNNAMPCGSTIGPISATRLGIDTVDVGVGMLSMHSARELTCASDLRALAAAVKQMWIDG